MIEGRLKLDQWEKDGKKNSKLRVVGETMQLLGSKGGGQSGGEGGGGQRTTSRPPAKRSAPAAAPAYDEGADYGGGDDFDAPPAQDDIPF
ncbi:MAG: hypothetical protein QM811_22845 [Pirellulales bacterium]